MCIHYLVLMKSYAVFPIIVIALLRLREVKPLTQKHTVLNGKVKIWPQMCWMQGSKSITLPVTERICKKKTGWEKGKFGTSFPPRAPGFWPRWCYRISYLETSKHKQFTYHQGFFFPEPNLWVTEFTCLHIIIRLCAEQLWPTLKSILMCPMDSFKLVYKHHSVFVK